VVVVVAVLHVKTVAQAVQELLLLDMQVHSVDQVAQ
jgi:hypothetical protein